MWYHPRYGNLAATLDLTGENPDEAERIRGEGGRIVRGRVLGPRGNTLQPSRSLGNFEMRVSLL